MIVKSFLKLKEICFEKIKKNLFKNNLENSYGFFRNSEQGFKF